VARGVIGGISSRPISSKRTTHDSNLRQPNRCRHFPTSLPLMRPFVPILCNQVAALLLGIVGMKLVSTFIPPALNGYYALFITLTQIGVLVTHSGVSNHATRYWQRES